MFEQDLKKALPSSQTGAGFISPDDLPQANEKDEQESSPSPKGIASVAPMDLTPPDEEDEDEELSRVGGQPMTTVAICTFRVEGS